MTLSDNNKMSQLLLKAARIYSNPISSESILHRSPSPQNSCSQQSVTCISLEKEHLKDQKTTLFLKSFSSSTCFENLVTNTELVTETDCI